MATLFRTSRSPAAAAARTIAQAQVQPATRSLASHASASSSQAPPAASSSSSASPSSSSSSSLSAPKWKRPIPEGKCAAYDEALSFISSQSASVRRELEAVRASSELPAEDKADALQRLAVASEINDPRLRWEFEKTPEDLLDLTQPTIRYLRERAWKQTGPLDKLVSAVAVLRKCIPKVLVGIL